MKVETQERLPATMAAVVCHGPEDYRLEEYRTPTPGAGEVLLRVESVGICASDLKCYTGAPLFWGTGATPGYCQPPVIPGHEFVGTVVALGEGAGEKYGLSLGDVAVSEQIVPCWKCRFCQRGQYWMCPNGDVYGFRQRAFGAMAEYVLLPDRHRHAVKRVAANGRNSDTQPAAARLRARDRIGACRHRVDQGDAATVAQDQSGRLLTPS